MGLLGITTQESYYNQSQNFVGDGTTVAFTLSVNNFNPLPTAETDFEVFVGGSTVSHTTYTYSTPTLTFDVAPASGAKIVLRQTKETEQYGGYQYIGIDDIINNFIISYVGEDKIISKVKRTDVAFHAQRAIQELSYDTLKSTKSQEIEIPPSLVMILPQDFVNYVKLTWKDNSGIENIIYPTRNTSNPTAYLQDSDYNFIYDADGNVQRSLNSLTWDNYSTGIDYSLQENDRLTMDVSNIHISGSRFGLSPEHSQSNGSFFIDQNKGMIYFSSNILNKIVTLKYISDGLGLDSDMVIHKFAEEAIYKYLAYAVLSSKSRIPEYIVARFKKEKSAAIRNAKLRLSNLKSEELVQVMRNKSKQIKH